MTQCLRTLKKSEYLCFLTEPGLGRRYGVGNRIPRSLPNTRNIFHSTNGDHVIRSCIVADPNQEMDLLPQFTDGDVTTVLWRTNIAELNRKTNRNIRGIVQHNQKRTTGGEIVVRPIGQLNNNNDEGSSSANEARETLGIPMLTEDDGQGDHGIIP